jgi:hypothetical protein
MFDNIKNPGLPFKGFLDTLFYAFYWRKFAICAQLPVMKNLNSELHTDCPKGSLSDKSVRAEVIVSIEILI